MRFEALRHALDRGTPCVWVEVAGVRGSAPREQGAGMLVMRLNPPGDFVTTSLAMFANGKFTPVTMPDGVTVQRAPGVNKRGQIAGTFTCASGKTCAYVIQSDGTFTRLPDSGGSSSATAINDAGDVVGFVVAPGDDPVVGRKAVLWPHDGGMTDLSVLTAMKLGTPVAINQRAQIAGGSPSGGAAGFFYDGNGGFVAIQPNGANSVSPVSLNEYWVRWKKVI